MIWVILRSGKVLQYNQAKSYSHSAEWLILSDAGKPGEDAVAKFPIAVVERAEFYRPCKVMKEKALRKIRKIYGTHN